MIYYLFQNILLQWAQKFPGRLRLDPLLTGLLDPDLDPKEICADRQHCVKNVLVTYTIFNSSVPYCFGSTRSEFNLFLDQDPVKAQWIQFRIPYAIGSRRTYSNSTNKIYQQKFMRMMTGETMWVQAK
jgi:hypothetical protein